MKMATPCCIIHPAGSRETDFGPYVPSPRPTVATIDPVGEKTPAPATTTTSRCVSA
jgi:hypothetical protein